MFIKAPFQVILLSLFSYSCFAASSGALLLSGTAPLINEVTLTGNASATSLNILAGESKKLIGTSLEKSNNLKGYKITMSSLNGGELRNTGNTTIKTSYKIIYRSGSAKKPPLPTAPLTVRTVASLSGLTTSTSNISITVTALPNAAPGSYTDTLTVSMIAN